MAIGINQDDLVRYIGVGLSSALEKQIREELQKVANKVVEEVATQVVSNLRPMIASYRDPLTDKAVVHLSINNEKIF